jgi:carbon-monoxide dehydrogenase medium subunit
VLSKFELERPRSVDEAVALLGEDVSPYCGGTELLLAMKMGLLVPNVLVDLKRVDELRGLELDGGDLIIKAGTSHVDVGASELVRKDFPVLADAEHGVGNARVRAQGSIGGNLCFAEPRSDIITVLAALDATVELVSTRGRRQVPVSEFIFGAYWCDREPDELLTDIRVPVREKTVGVYQKLQLSERPTVGVIALRIPDGIRIGVGAVSDKPLLVDIAESESIDYEGIADQLEPLDDLAGSVRYKKHVAAVYMRRAVAALAELP